MRFLLSWAFYLLGDLIYRVFERWTRIGMHWPIYCVYHRCMCISDDIQGSSSRGPWSP